MPRVRTARLLLVALVALAGAAARADDGLGQSRVAGVFVGLGKVRSANFSKDMRAYAASIAITEGSMLPQSLVQFGFAIRLTGPLYLVPDVAFAGYGPTEASGVVAIEYGAGLRWYPLEPGVLRLDSASFAAYVQGSLRMVTGTSQLDGFPLKSDGLSEEVKGGLELCLGGEPLRHLRLGFELGWSNVPMKAPIDAAYVAGHSFAPKTALGGNYGGTQLAVTFGWWFL